MSKKKNQRLVAGMAAVVVAMAMTELAGAQVSQFAITKQAEFSQTTTAAPTTPTGWSLQSEIFFSPGDIIYCEVIPPAPGATVAMFREPERPSAAIGGTQTYPTSAALDADYPAGPYTMSIVTGGLAGQQATVQMPQAVYAPIIPAISPASFNAIQSYNPASGPLHLSWSTFQTPAGFTEGEIVARLVPVGGDSDFFAFEEGGPAEDFSSVDVPASILGAEQQFTLELSYYVRNVTPGAGFDGADGEVEFLYITRSLVTVVPEPGALGWFGLAALPLTRRRR